MEQKILVFLFIAVFIPSGFVKGESFPYEVPIIERHQANYLTPENAFSAVLSCVNARDLEWCDETMTVESVQEEIRSLAEAGIDRNRLFDLGENVEKTIIIDKIDYRGAVVFIAQDIHKDGEIWQGPAPFVLENGLWKMTQEFAADPDIHSFLDVIRPSVELFDGPRYWPWAANKLLSYASPSQVRNKLPKGTTEYKLHIYYGDTIKPKTFFAVFNQRIVTDYFSPVPSTNEEVVLPLKPGKNRLVLWVRGEITSEMWRDEEDPASSAKPRRLWRGLHVDVDHFVFKVSRK